MPTGGSVVLLSGRELESWKMLASNFHHEGGIACFLMEWQLQSDTEHSARLLFAMQKHMASLQAEEMHQPAMLYASQILRMFSNACVKKRYLHF